MNYQKFTQQVLKALRGRRSAERLSIQMGYSRSQVSRWESGVVQMPWAQFCVFLTCCGRKTETLMPLDVFGDIENIRDGAEVLRAVTRGSSISEVARRMLLSRFKTSRYLKGQSEIGLENIFKAMKLFIGIHFQLCLVLDIAPKIPEIRDEYESYIQLDELFIEHPYLGAFLWSFLIRAYRGVKEKSFRLVGISEKEEKILTKKCLKAGLLQKEKNYLVPGKRRLNLSLLSTSAYWGIRSHWLKRALELSKTDRLRGQIRMGYREISLHSDMIPELHKILNDANVKIANLPHKKLVNPDCVRVVFMGVLDPRGDRA